MTTNVANKIIESLEKLIDTIVATINKMNENKEKIKQENFQILYNIIAFSTLYINKIVQVNEIWKYFLNVYDSNNIRENEWYKFSEIMEDHKYQDNTIISFLTSELSGNHINDNKEITNIEMQYITSLIIYLVSIMLLKIAEPNLTWLEAVFTSVTARTTGFSTINMAGTLPITKLIISFLMIIGGAPGSTSGGIRITSIAILALTVRATLRNKKNVVVYYKKIDLQTIRQAITNIVICAMLVLISMFIMEKVQIMRLDNNLFMCASAFSATGLSVTNVAKMNFASKVILEALMYIGRVGPISILSILIFKKKENQNIEYVSGNVML